MPQDSNNRDNIDLNKNKEKESDSESSSDISLHHSKFILKKIL